MSVSSIAVFGVMAHHCFDFVDSFLSICLRWKISRERGVLIEYNQERSSDFSVAV